MHYRVSGLEPAPFQPLATLDEAGLAAIGARRVLVEGPVSAPCRIALAYAAPGEEMLLINYEHQPEPSSPYRAKGPIFVRPGAVRAVLEDELPYPMARSILSLRAYDGKALIVDAAVAQPGEAGAAIARLLERDDVAYLHAHYAGRGCYAGRIDRA